MKAIKQILTGRDNETHDVARWLMVTGALSMIAFTGWHLYKNNVFDVLNFGTAFGALLAAGGAAIRMKEGSEP